ncbi:XRE family transcriptional regulator [Bdellovibrio sp. KM01]|uniref:XRE family transcriptional regulator n=1 Tax=Bdellovibrio sp. KM01 TaxID=2748865 RepID=UPI0015E9DCE8|nr:XRE family transcriptional regulator [Bdellovibrio sp. KM01]QLY25643.1 XRE family transcriptional regulator [Bdellovibrio sp. KM01]
MKGAKLKPLSIEELAASWGIDYQVFKIKKELVDTVRKHCAENKISQRKLAALVPGLSQDRVSKIFSGQVGHMTIDKLIEILSALKYSVAIKTKAA